MGDMEYNWNITGERDITGTVNLYIPPNGHWFPAVKGAIAGWFVSWKVQ